MRCPLLLPASSSFLLLFLISLVDAAPAFYKDINESDLTLTDLSYSQNTSSPDETAYVSLRRDGAVAHLLPKPFNYPREKLVYPRVLPAKKATLPRVQGRKSALLGFLLFSAMCSFYFLHVTPYSARASYYTNKILDASSVIEIKLDKKVPFRTGLDTWLFTFSLVLLASGLKTSVDSFLHRRDVRGGIRTDGVPQLEGVLPLFMGLAALVSGMIMPEIEFLGNFGMGCTIAGAILFTASLLRRQRYLRRRKRAEAARPSSMKHDFTDIGL